MYRVEWIPQALGELANVWTDADADARRAISAAVDDIDRELETDPLGKSESRDHEERVLFSAPLAVRFEIESGSQVVRVLRLWRFQQRGGSRNP